VEPSDEIFDKIEELSEQGNVFSEDSEFDKAIEIWSSALDLLPEPKTDFEAYTWLSASTGDALYFLERYEEAKHYFYNALNGLNGYGNPFVHYRLGQCLIILGNEEDGIQSLLKAYMLDGEDIFHQDDEGAPYLQKLRERKLLD
jgi:tetratricopeptide (TPR) repeat protein